MLSPEDRMIMFTSMAGMTTKAAIVHLDEKGVKLSENAYNKKINELEDGREKRLRNIGLTFTSRTQHIIEKLESVEIELVNLYNAKKQIVRMVKTEEGYEPMIIDIEQDPVERSKILREIREIQPYISAYYNQAKRLIGGENKLEGHKAMGEWLRNEDGKRIPEPRE